MESVFCVVLNENILIKLAIFVFDYGKLSSSDSNLPAMGRFSIKLLVQSDVWSSKYINDKSTNNFGSST